MCVYCSDTATSVFVSAAGLCAGHCANGSSMQTFPWAQAILLPAIVI